jgi:hypothetical protein
MVRSEGAALRREATGTRGAVPDRIIGERWPMGHLAHSFQRTSNSVAGHLPVLHASVANLFRISSHRTSPR